MVGVNETRHFKFLAIADGSPSSELAAYFAARRAKHTDGRVILLTVVEPGDFHHWLGVNDEMIREARAEAEGHQGELAQLVEEETGTPPECVIAEGALLNELRSLIERDHDIRILVLGAEDKRNPGPLVQAMSRGGRNGLFGKRAIPVAMIPPGLTREDIYAIA
jgi:nucleotide-binding universal stress UspA family protein